MKAVLQLGGDAPGATTAYTKSGRTRPGGTYWRCRLLGNIPCILVVGLTTGRGERMTEAELVESGTLFYGLTADMLSIYLTATTGFLIVSYMVGNKLSRAQLITISSLYIIFAVISSYLAVGYAFRGMTYMRIAAEVNPDVEVYATNVLPIAMAFCLFGGIIACLKFLWDIRRATTE